MTNDRRTTTALLPLPLVGEGWGGPPREREPHHHPPYYFVIKTMPVARYPDTP
jgi:hypothetical protein